MRKRTIVFATACLALQALAMWSSFHAMNLVTDLLTVVWFISLCSVFVVLLKHSGDWLFRAPALGVAVGYVLYISFMIWAFYHNPAD